jgi:hypothetical protein
MMNIRLAASLMERRGRKRGVYRASIMTETDLFIRYGYTAIT